MARPIIRPDRRISDYEEVHSSCRRPLAAGGIGALKSRALTEEERRLVGYGRDLLGRLSEPLYERACANRGSQLRRIGATDHCIVCGLPALPGVTAIGHIHIRDLHLSPHQDATRVFCLCWHHHHGCYDQGYISILELLRAEEIWIENKRRPKPHPRDVALMERVKAGVVDRHCVWTERRVARYAVVNPDSSIVSRPIGKVGVLVHNDTSSVGNRQ
jgi:hypothetical protein